MAKITAVEAKYGHRLLVELDNNNVIYLNMSDKLDTVRFHDLKNENIFNDVMTDGYSVYWDFGRIGISLTEIYDLTRMRNESHKSTKAI